MKKSWGDFMMHKPDDARIDSFEAIKPDEKLIELAAKLLEQNRVILNTNYMIFQTLAQTVIVCKNDIGKEEP